MDKGSLTKHTKVDNKWKYDNNIYLYGKLHVSGEWAGSHGRRME